MKLVAPVAYGQLHLHPWELMRYTPGEIKAKLKGYAEAKKMEHRQLAWAVCHLMNATGNFSKKPVTMSDLTGEKPPEQKRREHGNLKEERDALRKRFGG